tara:strand:- start:635 stop:1333 length:699 start_codon:yes stop_codon:yes gene_type:complete
MYKLNHDEWLSNILNKKAYKLKEISNINSFENLPKNIFIEVKIRSNNLEEIKKAEQLGFKLIDIGLYFFNEKFENLIYKKDNLQNIRYANIRDEKAIRAIASNSFTESRFYKDIQIKKSIASKIKEEWASNFFKGERGDHLIVAENEGKIIGFLLLIKNKLNELTIDLIAVDKKYRGRNFGTEMINFVNLHLSNGIKRINVGTQLTNIGAINLYSKLGYKLKYSEYIFHIHL